MTNTSISRLSRRLPLLAGLALAAVAAVACNQDKLLSVQSPSRIPAGALENPGNAQILVNGAVGDFECAFGAYVVAGGLIGNELADATLTADRMPFDRRTITSKEPRYATYGCEALGVYTPLQTARVSADNVRKLLATWTDQEVPNRQLLLATAAAYEGYTMVLFGEGFCSTVFSSFNADKTTNFGSEITPAQALDSAIARFTDAIQAAQQAGSGAQSILNLALVGRARAHLDKGELALARTDAAQVPANFVYNTTASAISGRRTNRVWANSGVNGTGPITSSTAVNDAASVDVPYRNLNDPRVPVDSTGRVAGPGVPIWVQRKYNDASASIRLASGDEAQLIIAEADLTTDPANSLAIINTFRARGNQAPLPAGTSAADLKAALIDQRARTFFLEGQHLGDMIRYQIPMYPAPKAAFPGGGNYGSQLCMPLPDAERFNNPKLKGS